MRCIKLGSKEYWNSVYENLGITQYDGWLDKYLDILKQAKTILDLGCGNGVNTIALANRNINVISCDISEIALNQLKNSFPKANTLCFDMSNGLPFSDYSIDVIISDLSLHYFDLLTTKMICKEINRVLTNDGILLCRVNSLLEHVNEINDLKLEPNFYRTDGCNRRYFNINSVYECFGLLDIISSAEKVVNKYQTNKHLIEFVGKKRN